MTDVWEISQRRTDGEDTDYSSIVLASEFQVLLYPLQVLNTVNDVMISTIISSEDLLHYALL